MKIKKYRPVFFEGFDDVYFGVNSKEELLASELCKDWIDDGYEICFSKETNRGHIMAINQAKNDKGAKWKNEQMMAKAVDGVVHHFEKCKVASVHYNDPTGVPMAYFTSPEGLSAGDKVKIIVIKED